MRALLPFATIGLVASIIARAIPCGATEVGQPDYKLHPGDEIIVGVFDDPKMKPLEITITPDGNFSFPLIGRVSAWGRTVADLRAEMETRLKRYIADPVVTLVVKDVKGNVAYVIGQVNKPGAFEMNPGLNVMQALSLAGGTSPYAKLDGIIVLRSSMAGQQVFNFRYSQVAGGRNLAQNLKLESGDVVVVP